MLLVLQAPAPLPLVPLPAVVQREAGALSLDRPLAVVGGGEEGKTLADGLKADGVRVGRGGSTVTLKTVGGLPPEGYRLRVAPDGATIEASTAAGLFYGGQTLRQLARMEKIPAVQIEDAPRFAWRGMMLDVSRHFRTVSDVKRVIDLNAQMKLNVFHWHLTDDGGWRMETKAYPELTRRGAWRTQPPKGKWSYGDIEFPPTRGGNEYGGFYTKKQIRDVVAYAAKRHVTVVPEIEMPGHAQAALQSLPWLGCEGIAKGGKAVALCPGRETTYGFLQKVLDETMELFPSKFIHVGGDEVDKAHWRTCPRCQERMKTAGLRDVDELQSYLIRRMDAYLTKKGRRLVGWDEILEGGLAPGATVMSWRGVAGGIAAAKAGREVVMSPTTHLYLDYSYETTPLSQVYAYDPVPPELSAAEARRVLGAQGNVWTEWLPDQKDVERMTYPRLAALAEVAWTPLARKSWPEFSERLNGAMDGWDRVALGYRAQPPNLPYAAYLSDEPVTFRLPRPRDGWGLAIGMGAQPLSLTYPRLDEEGQVSLRPGSSMEFSWIRIEDRMVTPSVKVQVAAGDRRESTAGLEPGLTMQSATGPFNAVPDTSKWGVAGIVTAIDLAKKPAAERFALGFSGFIRLPQEGGYTFTLRSDDGSVLRIGGLAVVDHDGEHAASAKSGAVWAKAGVYPFALGYFDAGGANSLSLMVKGPDGKEGPIPADWLWHSGTTE